MWRGLIGLLFVVAAIGCFVGARYAPEATNMYILIDLGCAALAGAVATQVPGAAAFFYSYIASARCHSRSEWLLRPCRIIGNRVGAVVFRLPLSCQRKHEPAPRPRSQRVAGTLKLKSGPLGK